MNDTPAPIPEEASAPSAFPAEPAGRKRPKPGERRVQILHTLATMLEQPGAERITTAALAAKLDVSEAALYRHFASKAQMFEGLIEFIEQSVFTLVDQIGERETQGSVQAQKILSVLLQFGEKNPGMTRVMVGDALVFENDRLVSRMNQFFDRIESQLRQSLRSVAESSGSLTPTVDASAHASVLTGFAVGRLQRYARSGFKRVPTEHLDAALQLLVPVEQCMNALVTTTSAVPTSRWMKEFRSGSSFPCEIEAGGERLALLPEKAAWLPEHRTLLIADAHVGKAMSFRQLGVPVPRGTTAEMLAKLDVLIERWQAQRIVFLGDFLHSERSHAMATMQAVMRWRAAHAELELMLVRGNHDKRAGDPPVGLRIEAVDEPLRLGGLALCHHPQAVRGAYALAGHLHPCVTFSGRAYDRLRLPCFHFGPLTGVLPAFGAFTGMHPAAVAAGDRVYAVADGRVVEVEFG